MSQATTRTRSARHAAPLVLATLGIALLSGCSGDEGATDAAASSSAPSSSAATSSAEASTPASSAPASSASAEAESETVAVTEGEMFIQLSEDSFNAGTYTFEVTNTGSMRHDFVVEQDGEDVASTDVLRPGESTTLEVDLTPGEYVFYCPVGAHRAAGMEVSVTVA